MQEEKKVSMFPSPVTQKSMPLHYFDLPLLSWAKSHTSNDICGRCKLLVGDSSSSSSNLQRRQQISPVAVPQPLPRVLSLCEILWGRSPARGFEFGASLFPKGRLSGNPEYSATEFSTNGLSDSGLSSEKEDEISEEEIEISENEDEKSVGGSGKVKDKINVRLKKKNKRKKLEKEDKTELAVKEVNDTKKKVETAGLDIDDYQLFSRTWNLRPRKPRKKSSDANTNASSSKAGEQVPQENKVKGNGGIPKANAREKKEKEKVVPNFSFALTRDEIEDDFFTLTVSNPSKRPKKRAKAIQKQLDNVFPGLWLVSRTLDDYKV